MYSVVIVEDQIDQAASIAEMVRSSSHADTIESVDTACASDEEIEDTLAAADIVVVDVHLEHTEGNGIDLVSEAVPAGTSTQVIYITDDLECATDVYRTNHTWLLAKPVEQEELDAALERAMQNLEQVRNRPLLVRSKGSLIQIVPRRILYVESDRRKVLIHERDGVTETYAKITEVEGKLPLYFARCHKSFLVNMNYIAELRASEAVLVNGETLPVSQRCRRALRERFVDYVNRSL